MDYPGLRRDYEGITKRDGNPERFYGMIRESLAKGHLRPQDFSIRRLFETRVPDGRELIDSWADGPNSYGGHDTGISLVEAGAAVETAAFQNISGQLLITQLMSEYTLEEFTITKMIPVISTRLKGEKLPGFARMGDEAQVVAEGHDFPLIGISEDWVNTPVTKKRGAILPLTREALFFDLTGQILRFAGEVGFWLGVNKEKRAVDCLIDENTTEHRYNRKENGAIATYQTTTPYDNITASNPLDDWTAIDAAEQTLNVITDPNTGEPVVISPDTLICTKQLERTALRILTATTVRSGDITTGSGHQFDSASPLGQFAVVSSRYMAARQGTDTDWFYGNPRRAFAYMENWPMTARTAPTNHADEFDRDIAMKWRADEMGAYATLDPRYMNESTA